MQKEANFDRATLDRARFFLRTNQPLDDMLKVPALAICLKNVALIRAKREAKRDVKKLQSNDID
ncbi:hypothetical protein [Undibacterium sp. Di24W]|uniref:hypothetical protein n=1 Tax=Undibacterium sp. Di24W TaxID=3413033 RepID=UPI003BEF7EFA